MTKPFEFHVVEAEKEEAMRKYNNQRTCRNVTRACAVALMFDLLFPTSLLAASDWFYRTGAVIVTNRTVVFVSANLLVALVFVLSRDREEASSSKPDLYDQYISSSSSSAVVIVAASDEKVVEDDDSKKQTIAVLVEEVVADKLIIPAFLAEVEDAAVVEAVVTTELKRTYRRTKSERKKKVNRPVSKFRRTESANSAIERLNSEEFRLKVEAFIMEKKRCLAQEKMSLVHEENDVVEWQEDSSPGLELVGAGSSYGS